MKKNTMKLFLGLILIFVVKANAQDCKGYFLDQKDKIVETIFYDAKDKEVSKTVSELVDIKNEGNSTVFKMKVISSSKDMDEPFEAQVDLICDGDGVRLDMSNVLAPGMLDAYKSMEVDMQSENLNFPKSMKAGDLLPPAKISITISNAGMTLMTMVTEIVNRKVEAVEKLTTPAGTFDCMRVSYVMKTDMGMMKIELTNKEWYAKGIGTVKSEMYNKKMELESWSQITSIK